MSTKLRNVWAGSKAVLTRLGLPLALALTLAACDGGGDSQSVPPSLPQLSVPPAGTITIAAGSQIGTVRFGDEAQRVFVMPGENIELALHVLKSDPTAAFDLSVTDGADFVSTTSRNGQFFAQVNAQSLNPGVLRQYQLKLRNQTSGSSAQVAGFVQVLAPYRAGAGSIEDAGGSVSSGDAGISVEIGAETAAHPLGLEIIVAAIPTGGRSVRLQFDRDISGSGRTVRVTTTPPPQGASVDRKVSSVGARKKPLGYVRSDVLTNTWYETMGAFTPAGLHRFDPRSPHPLGIAYVSCDSISRATTRRTVCYEERVAWSLHGSLPDTGDAQFWASKGEPVLFVHGFTASPFGAVVGGGEDTWKNFPALVRALAPAPKPSRAGPQVPFEVFEFRWATDAKFALVAADLATAIERIYTRTGGKRIHVVAHSFGGVLARTMLQDPATKVRVEGKVKQLISLGTPYSGIADKAGTFHGVDLPLGQDNGMYLLGLAFDVCQQISCHEMGEDTLSKTLGIKTARLIGVSTDPGELAASLALNTERMPADVPVAIGMGLKKVAVTNGFGAFLDRGDGLISLDGQRFLPTSRKPVSWTSSDPLQFLTSCERTATGPPVFERILGGDDYVPLLDLPVPPKGYSHNADMTQQPPIRDDETVLNHYEVAVFCDAEKPSECRHDSFLLVKAALE